MSTSSEGIYAGGGNLFSETKIYFQLIGPYTLRRQFTVQKFPESGLNILKYTPLQNKRVKYFDGLNNSAIQFGYALHKECILFVQVLLS